MKWVKGVVFSSGVIFAACSSPSPAKTDGGTDASADVHHVVDDGGGNDAGGCPSGSPACEVCDVSGYSPAPQVAPLGPNTKACPGADLQAFETACLASAATSSTCQAWQTAEKTSNAACLSCVFTNTTGSNWGPLVCDNNGCKLNIPGCLDLALNQVSMENGTSNGSCGDVLSASYGCQDQACAACTGTDFDTCANDAVSNECKSYADAFNTSSACSALQGDTLPANVSNCFPASTSGFTDQEFINFFNFFCGGQ